MELAPHQITVNNIGPGAIFTPIDADIEANPEMEKALMAEIPLGRWGKPEEVAGLAVYLASDAAGYCTGSTFFIDGGMLRQAGSLYGKVDVMSNVAQEFGQSERLAVYEIADDQLAVGSTLGGPKVACIIKATGAVADGLRDRLRAVQVFGTVLLRHYDDVTGMHLAAARTGTFIIHPEHQEHVYRAAERRAGPRDGLRPERQAAGRRRRWTRRGSIWPWNCATTGRKPVRMATYAYADLRGRDRA